MEECPVCLDNPKYATVTHCRHTFCGECMVDIINHNRRNERVPCPNCRKPVENFVLSFTEDEEQYGSAVLIQRVYAAICSYNRKFRPPPNTCQSALLSRVRSYTSSKLWGDLHRFGRHVSSGLLPVLQQSISYIRSWFNPADRRPPPGERRQEPPVSTLEVINRGAVTIISAVSIIIIFIFLISIFTFILWLAAVSIYCVSTLLHGASYVLAVMATMAAIAVIPKAAVDGDFVLFAKTIIQDGIVLGVLGLLVLVFDPFCSIMQATVEQTYPTSKTLFVASGPTMVIVLSGLMFSLLIAGRI